MSAAKAASEARRRKILARGSHRLAFVTGEVPSVTTSTAPPSAPPTIPTEEVQSPSSDFDPALLTTAGSEEAAPNFTFDEKATPSRQPYDEVHKDSHVHELETPNSRQVSSQRNLHGRSTSIEDSVNLVRSAASGWKEKRLITSPLAWDRVGLSIDVTQNFRAVGALSLALILVAQSCLLRTDLQAGNRFAGWVLPWPVAVVIVTDISLVCGTLLLGLSRFPIALGEHESTLHDVVSPTQDRLSQIVSMSSNLEFRLKVVTVIFKASRAFFLDCSIYVVTLISGYSLIQNLQSLL